MSSQQELFEQRYAQISKTDRIGWSDEETCRNSIEMYRRLLESVQAPVGPLLELGCGRGNIALAFAKEGWPVTGIDFSPTAIEWAKDFARIQKLSGTFVVGDLGERWKFDSDSFSVVIDANCLHFFHGAKRAHYLAEAKRVLAGNGFFVLSSSVNQPDPANWEMLGYDPEQRVSIQNGVITNTHVDAADLIQEVISAGFRILASIVTSGDNDLLWIVAKKI